MPSFVRRASRELAPARQLSCDYPSYTSCDDHKDNCKYPIGLSADQMATAQACGQSVESAWPFHQGMPWPPQVFHPFPWAGQSCHEAAPFGLYPRAGAAVPPPAQSLPWAPHLAGLPWGMQLFPTAMPASPWYQHPQMGGRQGDLRRLIVGTPAPTPTGFRPQYTDADVQHHLEKVAGVCRQSRAQDHYAQVAQWGDRFSQFLGRLPAEGGKAPATMLTATPVDVCLFMTMEVEPNHGRTKLKTGEIVPAFSTVKGVLSFIRAALETLGREGEYYVGQGVNGCRGNPCESLEVRRYRTGYEKHLTDHGVEVLAAVALTKSKYHALVDEADSCAAALRAEYLGLLPTPSQSLHILIYERDAAMMVHLWESHQRGSEGGRLRPMDVQAPGGYQFPVGPNGVPVLAYPLEVHPNGIKQDQRRNCGTITITSSDGDDRYDLVARLNRLMALCAAEGHYAGMTAPMFRVRDSSDHGHFGVEAVDACAVSKRMQVLLGEEWEGETSHSNRRGSMQDKLDKGESPATVGARMQLHSGRVFNLYASKTRPTRGGKPSSRKRKAH